MLSCCCKGLEIIQSKPNITALQITFDARSILGYRGTGVGLGLWDLSPDFYQCRVISCLLCKGWANIGDLLLWKSQISQRTWFNNKCALLKSRWYLASLSWLIGCFFNCCTLQSVVVIYETKSISYYFNQQKYQVGLYFHPQPLFEGHLKKAIKD